jgi:purine nucleosidase
MMRLFIFAAFAQCLIGCEEAALPDAETVPEGVLEVVIDTDLTNEIDDEFALAYALLSPERLNVRAIHAAPYSLSPALVESGALSVLGFRLLIMQLETLGLDLSVTPVRESGPSMEMAFVRAQEINVLMERSVDVRRGSNRFLDEGRQPVESDAARNLISLANEARAGKLYVVSQGALTNVASALLLDASIAERIVVVWTSAYPSYWPRPNASFNLVQDVEAARVVFESGATVVYLPGYFVGEKLRVTRPEMVEYVQGQGAVGDYLFELYDGHPIFGHYAHSKVIWDMVTVAYLVEPEWFLDESRAPLTLDADLRWVDGAGASVREVLDVDRDRVFRDFYEKLAARGEPQP